MIHCNYSSLATFCINVKVHVHGAYATSLCNLVLILLMTELKPDVSSVLTVFNQKSGMRLSPLVLHLQMGLLYQLLMIYEYGVFLGQWILS